MHKRARYKKYSYMDYKMLAKEYKRSKLGISSLKSLYKGKFKKEAKVILRFIRKLDKQLYNEVMNGILLQKKN